MRRIKILDKHTSNKIAAGEVVERPSSVVKELLENAIDANSKNITIEIEDGGVSLIKIIDDGDGILSEDLKKAFMAHATSKITSVEDIYSIGTLGFRGEALASIASVSKVNLKSKPEEQEVGREIILNAGKVIDEKDSSINKGTTIEVKDLFYNIPARRKFLKSYSREGALISDIITRLALSNPTISFKFYNKEKKVLHTYGNGNLKDTIRAIYSKEISENVIYFENIQDEITIYGYIGKENIAKGSRNNQSIFVNGRYIKNRMIVTAVENAFRAFTPTNKFPFFTLFIEVYPEFVDVNIHPTKEDIKFREDRAIFKKVFDLVHKALKDDVFEEFKLPEEEDILNHKKQVKTEVLSFLSDKNNEEDDTKEKLIENKNFNYNDFINSLKEEEEKFNKLKEATIPSTEINTPKAIECTSLPEIKVEKLQENKPKFPKLRVIGQFNKVYILGEYEDVLYLIDQHAAHEKILFEKYVNEIEEGSIVVQPLLIPTLIDLNCDDFAYYEENKVIFENAGFKIEKFGGNTLAIKEVPYFLGKINSKELFVDILDNIKQLGSGKTLEVKYNKIASMACRAAVKANDILNEMEMDTLIDDLRFIQDPFHCPHGRPIIIKYTCYELDKKFKRVL